MNNNDNDKFILYSIIVLLSGIIVLGATFIVLIKSAALQYISGGAIFVSAICLIHVLFNKLKNSIEKFKENKNEANLKSIYHDARSPLDEKFFYEEIGNYNNNDRMDISRISEISLNYSALYNIIRKYSCTTKTRDFIIYLRTNKLLNPDEEQCVRDFIQLTGSHIAILKDISSFNVPEGLYDVNVIYLKFNITQLLDIFNLLEEIDLNHINICDDYNPTVFSEKDALMALNNNYRLKISFNSMLNEYTLFLKYNTVKNTKAYMTRMLNNLNNGTNLQ